MRSISSNVRCKRERDEAGALPRLDLRLSDFCSTSRKVKRIGLVFEETEFLLQREAKRKSFRWADLVQGT